MTSGAVEAVTERPYAVEVAGEGELGAPPPRTSVRRHWPDPDPRTLLCPCGRLCVPTATGWRHAPTLCGAEMRYGETCARSAGHAGGNGGGHRSRHVMDNDARMRRGKWAA